MIALSRRASKPEPAHVLSKALRWLSSKTGGGSTGTLCGLMLAIGETLIWAFLDQPLKELLQAPVSVRGRRGTESG